MIDPNGNTLAFTDKSAQRGHVESYFIKLNSPDGAAALWLRWTLFAESVGAPRAECWAIAFRRGQAPRAFKRSMTLDPDSMLQSPFALDFAGVRFDGARAVGAIETTGSIRWNFVLEQQIPSLRPLPYAWMYRAPLPEFKLTSPVPDAIFRGEFTLDGERVDVTGWRGMQGHNWGKRHTWRYAWCQATGFEDADDIVFEGFTAQLHKLGMALPPITVAFLWIDNGWVRFDAPSTLASATASMGVMRWQFATRTDAYQLRGEATAVREETAGLHYANPNDAITYCLNSKLASLVLTLTSPQGTRVLKTRRAALELGWPTADHGIAMVA